MTTVVMSNESGWPMRALQMLLTFEGVVRVDGLELLPNGRFRQMEVHFPNEQMAAMFAQGAAQSLAAYRS
jgi:hypothetical protein